MTPLVWTDKPRTKTLNDIFFCEIFIIEFVLLAGLMEDNYVVEGEGEAEGKGA